MLLIHHMPEKLTRRMTESKKYRPQYAHLQKAHLRNAGYVLSPSGHLVKVTKVRTLGPWGGDTLREDIPKQIVEHLRTVAGKHHNVH